MVQKFCSRVGCCENSRSPHASPDSLRAIVEHKFVGALEQAGEADLSADVDFAALARVATAVAGVAAESAVGQGQFLICHTTMLQGRSFLLRVFT